MSLVLYILNLKQHKSLGFNLFQVFQKTTHEINNIYIQSWGVRGRTLKDEVSGKIIDVVIIRKSRAVRRRCSVGQSAQAYIPSSGVVASVCSAGASVPGSAAVASALEFDWSGWQLWRVLCREAREREHQPWQKVHHSPS